MGDIRNTSVLYLGFAGSELKHKAEEKACSILATTMDKLVSHPDFLYVDFNDSEKALGSDKVKEIVKRIIDFTWLTATYEMKVVVIDHMDRMSVVTQNKLLKTIEEANAVVLGIAYEDRIIPTLKSRMRVISVDHIERVIPENTQRIFDEVKNCLLLPGNAGIHNLLSILSLVKEKDPKSFFLSNREYVPDLIEVLSGALIERQITYADRDYSNALGDLCRERGICTTNQYSKDDFFGMIVSIIERI